MDTYQIPTIPVTDDRVPEDVLEHFRLHLQYAVHDYILTLFNEQADGPFELTQKKLCTRLHKDPARISRLLGDPGNWTLNTLSDLLVGMGVDPRSPFDKIAAWEDAHRAREGVVLPGDAGERIAAVQVAIPAQSPAPSRLYPKTEWPRLPDQPMGILAPYASGAVTMQ